MEVRCPACGRSNVFEQPYAYHAGFSDQAFLYNDAGNCTLVWSIYDPMYNALLARHGLRELWELTAAVKHDFEQRLPLSSRGDLWRFANSPRCVHCSQPVAASMGGASIYYLLYPDSIVLSLAPFERPLQVYLEDSVSL